MKRGLIIATIFVIGLFMLSFVSAQNTCESLGYECGVWDDLDCGDCPDSGACIVGECYSSAEVGECIARGTGSVMLATNPPRNSDFSADAPPCDFFSLREGEGLAGHSGFCKLYGCEWDDETFTCAGNTLSCLEMSLSECSGKLGSVLSCEFEKTPFLKNFYWQIDNIPKSPNSFAVPLKLTRTKLNELREGETIPIKIVYENSGLSEGTEVYFEIYSMGDAPIIIEHLEQEPPVGIRTGENAIKGVIDGEGDVEIEWDLSGEDLDLFDYDGNNWLSADLSLKDGTKIVSKGYVFGYSGFFRGMGTIVSYEHNIHNAFHIESVTAMCTGQNLVPCSAISSKSSCEFLAREFKDFQGSVFSEDIEVENACAWNEVSNSCEGVGFSCAFFGGKKDCEQFGENYGCYWEADSFWITFTSWLKSLFGF